MEKVIKGKAFVYGANIDTDQIYPGRFLELTDPEEVGKHAMEGADPGFVKAFQPGDIIVASTNFGCGSSREQAAIALKARGVGCDPRGLVRADLLPERRQPGHPGHCLPAYSHGRQKRRHFERGRNRREGDQ